MKNKTAKKFFAYVAKHFPVMCASGAFPLMPPVSDSSKWMDRLDDLSSKGIERHVTALNGFKTDFLTTANRAAGQEEKAEALALALSVGGAITELYHIRAWDRAPEHYLLIAFTGLEQAADMPAKSDRVRQKRFIKRLRSIPALLEHAPGNIETISATSRATSQTMIRDCARYLTELGKHQLGRIGKAPHFLADALESLKEYDRFVTSRTETPDTEGPSFQHITKNVFGTDKTPQDILALAEDEIERRLQSLHWLQTKIGGGDWKTLYNKYQGPPTDNLEALDLIVREIHRLRSFVQNGPLADTFADTGLRVDPQPLHMASTLRPIHLDPTLGAWENESSRCYVSPQIFSGNRFRDTPDRLARIRKEFPFMAAAQTYPGRHLLDSQRRLLGESPLSQVTNPLFMAGWLAFSENLLEELGYMEAPLDRLVHHVRGLRRATLAKIDAGLAMNTLDQDRCLDILGEAGFSREEGLGTIRTIRLAPAKKAMPVLGLHEITALRKEWNMDLGSFCKTLFAGGQLPFSCIRREKNL